MSIYKLTIFDNNEKSIEISEVRKIFNIIIPKQTIGNRKILFSHQLNKIHNIDGNQVVLFTDLNMIDNFINRKIVTW